MAKSNIIVSMISDRSDITSEYNTTQETKFILTDKRGSNVRDYSLPGMVVFCGFTWIVEGCLTVPLFALLEKIFFCKGYKGISVLTWDPSTWLVGKKVNRQVDPR